MAQLTLRSVSTPEDPDNVTVNRPLTNVEIDNNFINLDNELMTKAPIESPSFTGVPTTPTAAAGNATLQLANTSFVSNAVANAVTAERTASATLSNKTLMSPSINNGNMSGTFSGNITYSGSVTFSAVINGTATSVVNGVYTTGDQTIAGTKTFSNSPIALTEWSAGNGNAGEKRFRLKNEARDVFFYLNDSGTVGLWDTNSSTNRWSSTTNGTFSVSILSAQTANFTGATASNLSVTNPIIGSTNTQVTKTGDTMTGFLTLHSDPINWMHAATKQYVDNKIAAELGPYKYVIQSSATYAIGYSNVVGAFRDNTNYFDVFPPAGYTMGRLVAFIPSIHVIHFNGAVNYDDSMRCSYAFLADRIRVYVQNTEQRSTPAANWLAVWR